MKQMQPTEKRRPQSDIKWIRLQEICRNIAGRELTVEIHASTDIPAHTRAEVIKEGHRVDIALNFLYNKTLDDVIESLTHELTHIILGVGDEGHDNRFAKKMKIIQGTLIKEYSKRDMLKESPLVLRRKRPANRS